MADHRIILKPGTDKVGPSAAQLLADKNLKQSQIKCPLCGMSVELPSNLEEEIRAFAQKLGGEHMPILLTINHPAEIPVTKQFPQHVSDPQREAELRDAWQKGLSS
jgi:hypothetical protein